MFVLAGERGSAGFPADLLVPAFPPYKKSHFVSMEFDFSSKLKNEHTVFHRHVTLITVVFISEMQLL